MLDYYRKQDAISMLETVKELWNGGNVTAGIDHGDQTFYKKPYGYFVFAIAFWCAIAMIVWTTVNEWTITILSKTGSFLLNVIDFMFKMVMMVFLTPCVVLLLFINPVDGNNTKLGKLVTK